MKETKSRCAVAHSAHPIPPYLGLAATAETTTGENGNQNENGNNEYRQRQCSWNACGVICKCKRTVLKYIFERG